MVSKTLHLTLKKKWFDMIASGEKKEEYREMKPYWTKRLFNDLGHKFEPKAFDKIVFRNGYAKDAPTIEINLIEVIIGSGNSKWGAELNTQYYVIKLGDIINNQPSYVCADCGIKYLTEEQKKSDGHATTFHMGKCHICQEYKGITHIRAYNYLNNQS